MASIGSLSSSTSSSITNTGIRGYGGLASGLDRDSLIEQMTSATQAKINTQEQKKQTLEWQQEIYQNISSSLLELADKYTATFTSSTNLFSDALWGSSLVSLKGENSKYVTITGSPQSGSSFSIVGVSKLASNAIASSKVSASDQTLKTGTLNLDEIQKISNVSGKYLTFQYGDESYTVKFPEEGSTVKVEGQSGEEEFEVSYDTPENIAKALNAALQGVTIEDDKKLSDVVEIGIAGGKLSFKNIDKDGNLLRLTGGTAQEVLGIKLAEGTDKNVIDSAGLKDAVVTDIDLLGLYSEKTFEERLAGQSLTFTYNGSSKAISFTAEELSQVSSMTDFQTLVQKKLDNAFGKNRLQVSLTQGADSREGTLSIKTVKPDGAGGSSPDTSSVISVTSNSSGLLGEEGLFHMQSGESNRLNQRVSLESAGLSNYDPSHGDTYSLTINGKTIEFNKDEALVDILERINETEDIGVQVKYQETSDKFVITSLVDGASGDIQLSGDGAELLFGVGEGQSITDSMDYKAGQDAEIGIRYNGSDEVVTLTRGSNSFMIDGMTVSVNGTFNETLDPKQENVSFEAKADSDKIVEAISSFVEEYNAVVDYVNQQISTFPDRDYFPLSDAQKEEMTEEEIEKWETKAKEGLLFNDSLLRQLTLDLRFVMNPADYQKLEEMGLSVPASYAENGKLVFDESKFRAALENDPEAVRDMFTKEAEDGANVDGIAVNLKNTLEKYVKSTGAVKGALIERAGSDKVPTSLTANTIYEQLKDIDEVIEKLQSQMETERDRYIQQFTTLETLISQMNTQSSYLSGLGF